MKEETRIELFRIARDMAVASHKHEMERSDMAKTRAALERSRASDDAPPKEPPSIQALFEESYRFMASELSAVKNAGHTAPEKNEP